MQSVQENIKFTGIFKVTGQCCSRFSSGVDSTFLLAAAKETLGADHVIAVTASSCSFPKRELEEAKQFARSRESDTLYASRKNLISRDFARIRRTVAISANMNCLRKYWKLQRVSYQCRS